jgi:hypothetical protein
MMMRAMIDFLRLSDQIATDIVVSKCFKDEADTNSELQYAWFSMTSELVFDSKENRATAYCPYVIGIGGCESCERDVLFKDLWLAQP